MGEGKKNKIKKLQFFFFFTLCFIYIGMGDVEGRNNDLKFCAGKEKAK